MYNLTGIDQAIVIIASVGFVSGVVYSAIDEALELLIRRREINLGIAVRKCIFLGFSMAVIFAVMAFAWMSTSSMSIQTITQTFVSIAISFAVFGSISGKLSELIFSKSSSQR